MSDKCLKFIVRNGSWTISQELMGVEELQYFKKVFDGKIEELIEEAKGNE